MMKGVLSYLGKAKQILDKDSNIIKKQSEVVQKVSEVIKNESNDFKEKHKVQLEEKKTDLNTKRKAIETDIGEKEKEIFSLQINDHFDHLNNFILTKSEPRVYWLPAQDNETSKKMFEESKLQNRMAKEKFKEIFESNGNDQNSEQKVKSENK